MKKSCLNRYSGLKLNARQNLRNRIVVPPMASSTATTGGLPTEATIQHYARLSLSGAALVIVEYTFVHPSGRSEENQLGITSGEHVQELRKIARVIKASGALAGIQLTHAGGKTDRTLTGGQLMGPSDVAVPARDSVLEAPNPMNGDEIRLWKSAFALAVRRAVAAGFDHVEFHSAHGYGLNQWLSPLTNRRIDAYGGSLANRLRLLGEIVQSARLEFPELLLSVRIPGQEFFVGGLSTTDAIEVARHLEKLGVNLIHVSSGLGGWRRPVERTGEGYLVPEAELIQKAVTVPVIGVGGIVTGKYIDCALRDGLFSLAAVGRRILQDPCTWRSEELIDMPARSRCG